MSFAKTALAAGLGRRLVKTSGELVVDGASAPLVVRRDDFGIVHIDAQNEDDVWFGLGFCHGQDRSFQMEILLRVVRGTLSEVAGEEGLGIDRLSRRLGFRRAGASQFAVAEPVVRAQIEAYVAGINAGRKRGASPKPHELVLLGCDPTPWEPADVQGFLTVLCFALASNWDQELLRYNILRRDGERALRHIDAAYPTHGEVTMSLSGGDAPELCHLTKDLEHLAELTGLSHGGSNGWVVAPERSRTGRPIMGNDPHLPAAIPSSLYLARVSCPSFTALGGTFVGTPAIASGHNGQVAWGVTAAHADNTDLFIEQLLDDGASVRGADGPEPCDVREETISVKGRKRPLVEKVITTPRGPIISDVVAHAPGSQLSLSFSATWLKPRPQRGLFRIHDVKTVDDVPPLFEQASTSSVSMVYADRDGHIGWCLGVEIPKRRKAHGSLPVPAWRKDCQWEADPWSWDSLPKGKNPNSGFFAAANNRPVPAAVEPFLGNDFLDGYRQATIADRLRERTDWDVPSTAALQLDTTAAPWAEMKDVVLKTHPLDADAKLALDLLHQWDGVASSASVGASVYELFVSEMCQRIMWRVAPRSAPWALGAGVTDALPYSTILTRRTGHLVELLREQPREIFSDWHTTMSAAAGASVRRLRRSHGGDPYAWTWGRVRPLVLKHTFGEKKALSPFFDVGPLPGEGDANTISQGQVDYQEPLSPQISVAAARIVVDVGNWDSSQFALAGGQSGNPASPHYADQLGPWRSGQGIPIPFTREASVLHARTTLRLVPR